MNQQHRQHEAWWKTVEVALTHEQAVKTRAFQIRELEDELTSKQIELDELKASPLPTTGFKDVKCPREEAMWESYYQTITVFPDKMGDQK